MPKVAADQDTAAAQQLFGKMTALSAQARILVMFKEVMPALLVEQREMRSALQQFHQQLVKLTGGYRG